MKNLEGKIAVVTGGSSGIGLATAKRFVDEGAHVVITGRREKELKEASTFIERNVTTVVGDVSRLEDLDRLYAVVKEKHGHIDILFANAGAGTVAPLAAATEAHFDQTFDVNVKGLFFTVQKALPLFRDGGSIILNSSVSNVLGLPGFTAYAASKAAVRNFARGWASELKDRKIRVNAMSPGAIDTPALATTTGLTAEQAEQAVAQFTTQIPMGRRGMPEEIAAAVAFLASADSSYITGIDLAVDGGDGAGLTPAWTRDYESSFAKEISVYNQAKLSELIRFARVEAGSTVIDVYPGDGDWTRLFSDVVGPEGRVFSFVPAEVAHFKNDPVGHMRTLAKEPGRENVEVVSADLVAMPEVTQPADVLWLHLFYHDLHTTLIQAKGATAAAFNRAVYERLKPGGSYVIVDHAAAVGAGTSDSQSLHRIDPASVREEVEAAGFVLDAQSTLLAKKDDPHSVKVFDPSIKGETDRFAYRFVKA